MSAASHVRRLPTLNESLPAPVTSDLSPCPALRARGQIKAHSHLHADTMLAIRPRLALQSNVMRSAETDRRRAPEDSLGYRRIAIVCSGAKRRRGYREPTRFGADSCTLLYNKEQLTLQIATVVFFKQLQDI